LACSWCWAAAAQASWTDAISGANPLHWFRFEETSGAVADDQGSANVDGTYVGGVTLGEAGLVGKAARFNGADGHVLVGGPLLAGDWTVETIFLADTVNGGVSQGLMGADFSAAQRMALKAEQWNSTNQLGYTVFGVVDVTYGAPAAVTPSAFTHVAFVGSASGVELFVNGISAGTDATSTFLSRHVLGAGAINTTGALVDALNGAIDELVIYDRALTQGELAAHVAAIPEPCSAWLAAGAMLWGLGRRSRN
jgi:hypothetical protein